LNAEVEARDHRTRAAMTADLPDGIAAIVPSCGHSGNGFGISLTHPKSGEREGDFGWNVIWVVGSELRQGLQEMADQWVQHEREDSERVHATDLQIDSPEQTSLSSLPAIKLSKPDRTRAREAHLGVLSTSNRKPPLRRS